MVLDKERIKQSLTQEDINLILKDLGSNNPQVDLQGNQMYTTVCHGGSKHKLYYYHDSKSFHCYTDCGCSFDVFELVVRTKKTKGMHYTFPQSVQYVANLTGKSFTTKNIGSIENEMIDDWNWINRFKKKDKIDTSLPVYNENVLDLFLKLPHEEWLDEGISYETMQKFEIGYYIKGEKIVIPHRDIHGQLIGIRGRAMLQEEIDNGKKYMPLVIQNNLYNYPTMFNLYGLHKTWNAISRLKKAIIFEGEKSVLKCEDMYGENNFSVATCSSNISTWHRDMLLSLGVEEVFIAFDKYGKDDNEKKIIEYQEKLIKLARKFSTFVRVYVLWDYDGLLDFKDSPIDKKQETLEQLMRNKIEIKTYEDVVW